MGGRESGVADSLFFQIRPIGISLALRPFGKIRFPQHAQLLQRHPDFSVARPRMLIDEAFRDQSILL
jgi:hypothetical protein